MKRRDATKRIGGIDAKLPFGGARWSANVLRPDGIYQIVKFDTPTRSVDIESFIKDRYNVQEVSDITRIG